MQVNSSLRAITPNKVLGKLIGANMNDTTDNVVPISLDQGTKFFVEKIVVMNASVNLTTAAGGVYTAASKGGSAVVANTQVYSALTGATKMVSLTLAITDTVWTVSNLYLSLTTAQGVAATADIYVMGYVL